MTAPLMVVVLVSLLLAGAALASDVGVIIKGEVTDVETLEPIAGAHISLAYLDNGTLVGETVTDSQGRYQIPEVWGGWYLLTFSAIGYENWTKEQYVEAPFGTLDVVVDAQLASTGLVKPPPGGEPTPPYLQYAALAAIVTVTSLVMYSKIRRDNLLRHAVRRRIFEYIQENPGQHYRAILTDLDLPMGVLTYHLNRLEKGEYLRSRQDGMYRRFFVAGRRTEVRFFLSGIQESILATIRDNQGISQSRIADDIGVSRKVVNYHVKIMEQAGLIYVEERGRETACFAPVSSKAGVA